MLLTFSRCQLTHHVMAIQLVYRYHVTEQFTVEKSHKMKVKVNRMIQHFIVGKFFVAC